MYDPNRPRTLEAMITWLLVLGIAVAGASVYAATLYAFMNGLGRTISQAAGA